MLSRVASSRPVRTVTALAAVASLGLAACSSADADDESSDTVAASDAAPAPGVDAATVALEEGAAPIDVRTPEEHAAGHVEGDTLIDVQDRSFDDEIAGLDPELTYVVYCRSGNRSAQAAARMRDAGLTVLDGGAYDDMLAAGWAPAT